MVDEAVTTLHDYDIDRMVRAAGGGQVVDQMQAVSVEGASVVVLLVTTPWRLPTSETPGMRLSEVEASLVARVGGRRVELARRRREACKTQESLAAEVGVERTTVARWEAGGTMPSLWVRPRLANALDVSLEMLDNILAGPSSH